MQFLCYNLYDIYFYIFLNTYFVVKMFKNFNGPFLLPNKILECLKNSFKFFKIKANNKFRYMFIQKSMS